MLDVFQLLFIFYYFFFLCKLETLESVEGSAWCSYADFLMLVSLFIISISAVHVERPSSSDRPFPKQWSQTLSNYGEIWSRFKLHSLDLSL